MQLASVFLQLAAAGRIGTTKKNVNSALEWGKLYAKFSFREVYSMIYVRKSHFTAPLMRRRKTKFPTIYPTIYFPK